MWIFSLFRKIKYLCALDTTHVRVEYINKNCGRIRNCVTRADRKLKVDGCHNPDNAILSTNKNMFNQSKFVVVRKKHEIFVNFRADVTVGS